MEIKSPLGVRNVNRGQRVLDVPDAESEIHERETYHDPRQNDFDEQIRQINNKEAYLNNRKKIVKGAERLSDGALERISVLVGMLQLKRKVVIDQTVFELRTLKNHELREVILLSSQSNSLETPFELMNQYLARSLVSINNMSIENFIGDDSLEKRLLCVENLESTLVQRLYNEYLILKKQSEDHYLIKNDDDAKEIVENLKK